MKVIFAGTPEFGLKTLEYLTKSTHEVIAVYTQPDKPAGRGRKLTASPVKLFAEQHNLPVFQPKTLRSTEAQAELAALRPDVMVVVAYGLLLPQSVLDIPKYGCINIHPSLLPRWRGAAPIQRTILAGDKETGVAIMQLDAGMDTGPLLFMEKTSVNFLETSGQLHDRLSIRGAHLLLDVSDKLERHEIVPIPQSAVGVTLAAKVTKSEAQLNWARPALELQHAVCGYNPWPVAFTFYRGDVLRVWEAEALTDPTTLPPGTVIDISKQGIDVATGDGVLRIFKVQFPGAKVITASDFMNREQNNLKNGVIKFE